MAEIRCPKCGKNNSDLLDVCQFCQTPLKSDSVLRIGQVPTKKDTGELEGVLPAWLRDARQQSKSSSEEDAVQEVVQPGVEKNEPPDLLAGLASQSNDAGDDDIPDWLASINPVAGPRSTPPATEPESDFFAQFKQNETVRASEPVQEEIPPSVDRPAGQSSDSTVDELSQWFADAAEQPEEVVEVRPDQPQAEADWLGGFGAPKTSQPEPAPKEEEDLSWLHNLEESSKQTGDLQTPRQSMDWTANFEAPSTPSGSEEDLSWLNNLAGIEESQQSAAAQPFAQPFVQPPSKDDDLSWLNNLGSASEPQPFDAAPEKPDAARPFVSEEDLSWLSNLGAPAEPSQPVAPAPVIPSAPQEDLSWLNDLGAPAEPQQSAAPASPSPPPEEPDWLRNLGGTVEPSQPVEAAPGSLSSAQEDLSWLNELGGQPGSQFTPPFAEPESTAPAAPLNQASPFKEEAEPDWFKSALETPSTPAPGDTSLDWFTSQDQTLDRAPSAMTSQDKPVETPPAAQTPQPAPFVDAFSSPGEPSSVSNQDLDSLFSAEMPDWLSRAEPTMGASASQGAGPSSAESAESLAPVDLPSWVQAMRPVEAVISETAAGGQEEPEEKEGPLAGLRGVIPGLPIGSAKKPKTISLKLQATDEQQASAALLEQILGSETSPRALVTSSFVWSQRWLRLMLAGLFVVLLGLIIALRSNNMPIPSASLPAEIQPAADIVQNIPDGGRVLIIVDYEPALSGEMEAVSGPVLAHLTSLHHPILSFISTSPSGPGLVERLMTRTKINIPFSDGGVGYVAGQHYFNLGFLPGGSAGALGFVKGPGEIIPDAGDHLYEYAAIILMTDHAESGRVWVEQLYAQKRIDPLLTNQPLLVIASAQADPLLQPYVSSQQINGIVSGLSNAARYESTIVVSASPKTARAYWDAFEIGLVMSIALIAFGSLWSLFTGIRARRAETEQG